MSDKNIIEAYALKTTLNSFDTITKAVEERHGPASKNGALINTLLRFEEELIKSTSALIVSGKLNIDDLKL